MKAVESRQPIQFSIQPCFAMMVGAAIVLTLYQLRQGWVWRIIAPAHLAGYLSFAGFVAASWVSLRSDHELAWGLVLIGWSFSLIEILQATLDTYNVFSTISPQTPDPRRALQAYSAMHAGTLLASLLTIPTLLLVLRRSGPACRPFSTATCWLTVGVFVGFVNVVAVVLLTISLHGAQRLHDGTIEWGYGIWWE